MAGKRQKLQRRQLSTVLAFDSAKTEQNEGRDKTMLQKKTEYWQEVNSE